MRLSLTKYLPYILALGVALLVAGKALSPGYILLLDLPWAPTFPLTWTTEGLNNVYPTYALIHILTLVMSSWVVQKLFLIAMLMTLLISPWKYLPYVTNIYARIFGVLVFALNPFVYTRILSGQWFHVMGYALLPLLLYSLVDICREVRRRAVARLALALIFIGLFSVHFLYLALIISGIWIGVHLLYSYIQKEEKRVAHTKQLFLGALGSFGIFLIISSYWILPAMMRTSALESRFDTRHYMAFAAAPNNLIPVMQNVAALGGFWGEGMAWRYFFVWPQESTIFWVSFILLILSVLFGLRSMMRMKDGNLKLDAYLLLGIGILAYITALGAAITPFRGFNLFLYDHIPMWNGLRDSHKIVGVLALIYAVFGALGVESMLKKLSTLAISDSVKKELVSVVEIVALIIPVTFGMYMWGGLHNQLRPVYYPHEWKEAKAMLDAMPEGHRVLVLPWHSYLSLPFNQNRLTASPIESYFGRDRALVGRDVGIGQVHDQETDSEYKEIDMFVTNAYRMKSEDVVDTLKSYDIYGVLILTNPLVENGSEGMTKWTEFSEEQYATSTEASQKTWIEILPKKVIYTSFGESLILLNFQ